MGWACVFMLTTGLNSLVPFWKEALDMVLDVEIDGEESCMATTNKQRTRPRSPTFPSLRRLPRFSMVSCTSVLSSLSLDSS